MQQRKLHVRGHLRHEPPVLAQHITRAAHQGVMGGALLQRLQNLHHCKLSHHSIASCLTRRRASFDEDPTLNGAMLLERPHALYAFRLPSSEGASRFLCLRAFFTMPLLAVSMLWS